MKILALGDCNTQGVYPYIGNSFPERFAAAINMEIINAGYAMSTTREMLYLAIDNHSDGISIILIQYGLVDSWRTFKYSPYVLYYPTNFFKKIFRKLVKKYKKTARKIGLNKRFGEKYSVSQEEYKENIKNIILENYDKMIFLIETIPNHDLPRNDDIQLYNKILADLANEFNNCYKIDLYDDFMMNIDNFYLDKTHINNDGHDFIANKLSDVYHMIKYLNN